MVFYPCHFCIWIGQDIKGATIGIVGLGGIGQEIAKRLKGFSVGSILYTGHREKEEGLYWQIATIKSINWSEL